MHNKCKKDMYTHSKFYINARKYSVISLEEWEWRSGAFDFFALKTWNGENNFFCGQPGFVYFVLFFKNMF